MSRVAVFLIALASSALSLLSLTSVAQAVTLRAEISTKEARVGEEIVFTVKAVLDSDDPAPQEPRLSHSGKAEILGPQIGSERRISMHNFSVTQEQIVSATWTILPKAVGRLTIGPASFEVDGKPIQSEVVTVLILDGPPRTRGRSRRFLDPFSIDPFDPFGLDPSPFPSGPGLTDAPPGWKIDRAENEVAFLWAFVEPRQAIVGQSVRLTILAVGSQGAFHESNSVEPSTADFLSFPVVEVSNDQPSYHMEIEGREFRAKAMREILLVPLKAGHLSIGSMRSHLIGRGYGGSRGLEVMSSPVSITVTEPPQKGRPRDYVMGDVGRFELSAEVSPRKLQKGEYARVVVRLSGSGNPPSELQFPTISGAEWQESTSEGGASVKNGDLSALRTITRLIRIDRAGKVSLEKVTLPYFDPARGRYFRAEVQLGEVEVAEAPQITTPDPGTRLDPPPPESKRSPSDYLKPRTDFNALPSEASSRPSMWEHWLSLLPGFLTLLFFGCRKLWRLSREALRRQSASPLRPEEMQKGALALCKAGKASEALKETERSIEALLWSSFQVKSRSLTRPSLKESLLAQGLDEALCARLLSLLDELEAAQFAGSGASDTSRLLEEARALTQSIRRGGFDQQHRRSKRACQVSPAPRSAR